jgi:hypothetical protein
MSPVRPLPPTVFLYSGFQVHIGAPLDPRLSRSALEGLARA